jgi:hypothetical protein
MSSKLRVFDKKREREGKEEEKKRLIKKTDFSSSLPHLFLISSLSLPHLHLVLLSEKKLNFRTALVS